MKQAELGRQFARGDAPAEIADASSVTVVSASDDDYDAYVLSYGWAVIFARRADGGIVEFAGWHGYTTSTSTQMGKIRHGARGVLGTTPETVNQMPYFGSGGGWKAEGPQLS